ncbi:reverse transcriptase domain-containing protein [Tanacetum coccineum]
MAEMDTMTMKMDAHYKEFQSRSKQPNLNDDDIPISREEEANFMQTFRHTRFYTDYRERDSNRDNLRSSKRNDYNRDNYQSHSDYKSDLQKQLGDFIKSQHLTNSLVKYTFMDLKNKLETTTKNHQASIQNLEAKFDRFVDKQSGRPSGSFPSNTQTNLKVNPNDQQNDSETPINYDIDDEDDEPTPQPKPKNPKQVKETPMPKPYKPKIPYSQRLRKEKMVAQYGKFLDMIRAVRINVPHVDVFARMPNYGKFLKELVNNIHKIEQILAAFLTDLGASINLMPYSLYAKLSLKTLKPTKMGVRLADRSFRYPVGIAENMLVEVGKFTFSADFVILEMEEDKEYLDALLDKGSEILHSIEGTILKEKLFAEFDEFMAMTVDENSEFESNIKEPPFNKITFNTDYKIKTSLEEPPTDLELKLLPDNLEEPSFLPVIISS